MATVLRYVYAPYHLGAASLTVTSAFRFLVNCKRNTSTNALYTKFEKGRVVSIAGPRSQPHIFWLRSHGISLVPSFFSFAGTGQLDTQLIELDTPISCLVSSILYITPLSRLPSVLFHQALRLGICCFQRFSRLCLYCELFFFFITSLTLNLCLPIFSDGVVQPFSQLGWWRWMYRLSPYTYLIEGLLGQGKKILA